MKPQHEYNLKQLLGALEKQGGNFDTDLITRAFSMCVTAHEGQKRLSSEDYYIHPFSVAMLVISYGLDSQSVAAALLHDVVEDTPITVEQIRGEFGDDVALIVDGVTKLGKISFSSREEQQAENLRKMLLATAKDVRVIIIKLADRLHNMRTLDAQTEQKQRDKSLETLEIYAPIAHRLGIRALKEELEDLAIMHLDPVAYHEIEQMLSLKKPYREDILNSIKQRIETTLHTDMPDLEFVIEGRVKSIHGIYRKMFIQNKDFDEIYDVYALRIITDTVTNCYNLLGLMHDMFRPIPGRFKDYISTPKPNMYQSLHTTVIGRECIPFEIQIRTTEMHKTAEYGIAAHWKYKAGVVNDNKMDNYLAWIRQIIETQNDNEDASELVRSFKVDLSQDDVFAVTPRGDVINLPNGATVIDFAFAIHSAVGIKMVGAKVDGKIVPINHVIKTGEIIEILTSNQQGRGPSRDWINVAVTNQAKSKIRNWFKKERREENIITGKAELEKELKRNNIVLDDEKEESFIKTIAQQQKCASVEDFYADIGYGGIILSKIIGRIKDEYQKLVNQSKPAQAPEIVAPRRSGNKDGVVVDGIDNCLIKLSRCCAPLPGDDIIGFITRGHGVSVHKCDCPNVPQNISEAAEPERWVAAHWNETVKEIFTSSLQISGVNRDGMVLDITTAIFNMRVPMHAINGRTAKSGNCIVTVTVSAESVEHLQSIMNRLSKLPGVFSVERMNQ
ncbi:MAG: bifunctional (p)ppGpp synthetase/guanosine-3',5'-bis(diphosphate) 3'-pyrophosphohydrolase [Clostridia bacterium]|nr:bifunctional (p)ppGpp synthetase/guanosine-3',5'-bis(diphosphate) 3'-pyrophosphohydrolase [Clostridia bacterium]